MLTLAFFLAFRVVPIRRPARLEALLDRPAGCATLLFLTAILSRVILLPRFPVPVPSGADDFGYLLLADTLKHFRLANPPLSFPDSFAQLFVLQAHGRAAMFPLGQGLSLAAGWLFFGSPWAGVLVLSALLPAAVYWMLRGWISPALSLAGGCLSIAFFGPLCYWTNCYWGGTLSAIAGCLVFGALPRVLRNRRKRDAVILGIGLATQLLTRQFEFILLLAAVVLFLLPHWRILSRIVPYVGACLVLALLLIAAQNKAVTGSATKLPYLLYRYEYGVPATFTFQSNALPHQALNSEQALDYHAESLVHGDQPDSISRFLDRLLIRIRFYRFFLYAPLYIGLLAFLRVANRWRWLAGTLLLFVLGSNFYPYFYPHYIAAVACLFVLVALVGLRRLPRPWAQAIIAACLCQFLFWYGVHAFAGHRWSGFESWDFINGPDPEGRATIQKQLAHSPGKQLVLVHYSPVHGFSEWVHNGADPDSSPIIWVHDLGRDQNQQLFSHYPDRKAWLLLPDETPPKLAPYVTATGPFEDVAALEEYAAFVSW